MEHAASGVAGDAHGALAKDPEDGFAHDRGGPVHGGQLATAEANDRLLENRGRDRRGDGDRVGLGRQVDLPPSAWPWRSPAPRYSARRPDPVPPVVRISRTRKLCVRRTRLSPRPVPSRPWSKPSKRPSHSFAATSPGTGARSTRKTRRRTTRPSSTARRSPSRSPHQRGRADPAMPTGRAPGRQQVHRDDRPRRGRPRRRGHDPQRGPAIHPGRLRPVG